MGSLSPIHWLIVVLVLVVLFGAKRLPDASRSIGRSLRIFKSEMKDMGSDGDNTDAAKAAAPAAPPAPAPAPQQWAAAPVPTPTVSPHPQHVQAERVQAERVQKAS